MILVVAGSRSFRDYALCKQILLDYLGDPIPDDLVIISGTAPGADLMGEWFAKEYGIPLRRMPANWSEFGPSAGYRRNVKMADAATHCICFWDGESRGTKHMIDICTDRGIPCRIVPFNNLEETFSFLC